MAKRIYTPRQISPEIARENAISAAKANLEYARRELLAADALVARVATRGPVAADAVGDEIGLAGALRLQEIRATDLIAAQNALAELEAVS